MKIGTWSQDGGVLDVVNLDENGNERFWLILDLLKRVNIYLRPLTRIKSRLV